MCGVVMQYDVWVGGWGDCRDERAYLDGSAIVAEGSTKHIRRLVSILGRAHVPFVSFSV